MLRCSVESEEVEKEVDEAINHFDSWYSSVQTTKLPKYNGLTPAERAAIKTFVGYYLGVGGHYKPQENEHAEAHSD
jgi:hypothetical protein